MENNLQKRNLVFEQYLSSNFKLKSRVINLCMNEFSVSQQNEIINILNDLEKAMPKDWRIKNYIEKKARKSMIYQEKANALIDDIFDKKLEYKDRLKIIEAIYKIEKITGMLMDSPQEPTKTIMDLFKNGVGKEEN